MFNILFIEYEATLQFFFHLFFTGKLVIKQLLYTIIVFYDKHFNQLQTKLKVF